MSLESVTYVADLNVSNPVAADPKSQGDDHIRNIKTAVKNCFPGHAGAIVVSGTDGGAANTYTLTPTTTLAAYGTDMVAIFTPAATNTGASTLNISGLGAKDIKSVSGAALTSGDLVSGDTYAAVYNGTNFRLLAVTKNYVDQLSFSAELPAQTGNSGKFLTTDGTNASWASVGSVLSRAITGADTVGVADISGLIDVTSGTFTLAFAAVATLGDGAWGYIRNSGTGDVTLDPNSTEQIDGLTSFVMYPGAVRLWQCDGAAIRTIALSGGTKTFASTANYIWAPGVQAWDCDAIGAGAGGGGGARGAARKNGGGGGAGERLRVRVRKSQITVGASTACTVGAKGTGGAAAAGDSTSGSIGTNGGNTTIGALATAYGGSYGVFGHYAADNGGGGRGGSTLQISASTARVSQSGEAGSTAITTTPYDTEWAGTNGRAGDDVTATGKVAKLGGQIGGRGGASFAAGTAGGNGSNPGDGGDGGAGNINGSAAGKGGDGADGQITIVEVI